MFLIQEGNKMKTSKLRNFTAVLSKVIEIIAWVCTGICALALVGFFFSKEQLVEIMQNEGTLQIIPGTAQIGSITENYVPIITLIMISAIIVLILVAIMFRNINLIFKNSDKESPFSEKNVTLIKQIGYIAIATPIIEMIFSGMLGALSNYYDFDLDLVQIIFGLIILCLSQFFAYGASLEKDVNGLV